MNLTDNFIGLYSVARCTNVFGLVPFRSREVGCIKSAMLRSSARLERQVLRSAAIRASKRSLNTQPRRVHGSNAFIAVPVVSLAVIYLAWPVAAAESPQSGPSGQRTDSSSGVSFPSQIKPENAGSPLELVGLGVRTVTLFGIQVYTVGRRSLISITFVC